MKVSVMGYKWPLFAFFVFGLFGCSARWHVNQAIKKGLKVGVDTVYQEREVIVPGDSTTVFVPVVRDSLVTIYQDRLKIKYKIYHDSIKIHVQCPPDTVRIQVPVAVNTEIDCPPRSPFWRNLALALLIVTALVLYFRR